MDNLIDRKVLLCEMEKLYNERAVEATMTGNRACCASWNDAVYLVTVAPTIEAEPRWIPCSERLPEEQKKSYWVCTDFGYQCECRWTNINHFWTQLTTDWHWHLMDVPQYAKVVAWMPLPKPYKTDEVEE